MTQVTRASILLRVEDLDAAVNVLRRRRKSLLAQIGETKLGQDLAKIDAALEALTGEAPAGGLDPPKRGRKRSEGSVRFRAQTLLDEADRTWDYDQIMEEWERRGQPITSKAALRTALWTSRSAGEAIQVEEGVYKSAKFDGLDSYIEVEHDEEEP